MVIVFLITHLHASKCASWKAIIISAIAVCSAEVMTNNEFHPSSLVHVNLQEVAKLCNETWHACMCLYNIITSPIFSSALNMHQLRCVRKHTSLVGKTTLAMTYGNERSSNTFEALTSKDPSRN